jgi:hypothetical protein
MCDKYNNIQSLDVHLAFNGPFPPDMTNRIMSDIHKLLDSKKYDMLLHLFLELLHVVKDRNLDPDWQKKTPRVTAKNFDLQAVKKLLPKAKKKLGVNDFSNALYALVNDLLHVDLR